MVKLVYDISIVNGVYESIYNWGGTTLYLHLFAYLQYINEIKWYAKLNPKIPEISQNKCQELSRAS